MVMLRLSLATAMVASLFWATGLSADSVSDSDPLERARALLAREDGRRAVVLLEEALSATPVARRPALVAELRRAYELAARQAEAEGRTQEAEDYRENLRILKRQPAHRPAPPAPKPEPPAPKPAPPEPPASPELSPSPPPEPPAPASPELSPPPLPPTEPSRPQPEPSASGSIASAPPLEPPAPVPASSPSSPAPAASAPLEPPKSTASATPAPAPSPRPSAARDETSPASRGPEPPAAASPLAAADQAFRAQRYDEAGRVYGELARAGRLPADHRAAWGYCRCVAVVRRINAGPRTPAEWAAIKAELKQLEVLMSEDSLWYIEYLRNLVAERSAGLSKKRSRRGTIIRGSSPEDEPVRPRWALPRGRRPEAAPAPSAPPRPQPTAGPTAPGGPSGSWQVLTTANFRILHADPALAGQVGHVAEATRKAQAERWAGPGGRGPWTPKCDIYLYPTATLFSAMTGQPEDSPGFSLLSFSAGQIVTRRVNLRADHPQLLEAVLPHEVTHVVLADLFPDGQIPRWADEGAAVLSEPELEQRQRAADLARPLAAGRVFRVEDLMRWNDPDAASWGLFYAQSISLTRFLVEQGSPALFVQFLRDAGREGFEPPLRRIYHIDGFTDLQNRWEAYARSTATVETASAHAGADSGDDSARR
jgi:hypothetical protein